MYSTRGVLVTCSDPMIARYIRHLDKTRKFIIQDIALDELHILVEPSAAEAIRRDIERMQDELTAERRTGAGGQLSGPGQPPRQGVRRSSAQRE